MFVMQPKGILTRFKRSSYTVPAGVIAYKGDQFACSKGSCMISCALFDVDGLVPVLQDFLDKKGTRHASTGVARDVGVGSGNADEADFGLTSDRV